MEIYSMAATKTAIKKDDLAVLFPDGKVLKTSQGNINIPKLTIRTLKQWQTFSKNYSNNIATGNWLGLFDSEGETMLNDLIEVAKLLVKVTDEFIEELGAEELPKIITAIVNHNVDFFITVQKQGQEELSQILTEKNLIPTTEPSLPDSLETVTSS
jgi:hypothetical protein